MLYKYSVEQCAIPLERRDALTRFREKRALWLSWLDDDNEPHAITSAVSLLVWNDVSFRTLAKVGELEPNGCLSNSLVAEVLINGHFAMQTLAVRRLIDRDDNVISLKRLLCDIGKNVDLFTRENFVGFDGLPYDYETAEQRVRAANAGAGPFWCAQTGPDAFSASENAHKVFDLLSGIKPDQRSRTDCLPKAYVEELQEWIEDSGAKNISKWTNKYLAHAADPASRKVVENAAFQPDLNKITQIIRIFVRVSDAIHALFSSRFGEVMPVAQFNPFEYLNAPMLTDVHQAAIERWWNKLTAERNAYSKGVFDDLGGAAPE